MKYLPGITLPEHVKAEPDLKKARLGAGFSQGLITRGLGFRVRGGGAFKS